MTAPKLYIVIGLILAFGLLFGIVAYAENTSPQMMIRFSAPVHIPGQVLPARTYLLKCTNLDESVVRIFNATGRVFTRHFRRFRRGARLPTKIW